MRLLDRYLLREFLIPLGFCLFTFFMLWVSLDLFSELHSMLQEKHLRAHDIIAYYVFKSPEIFVLVLPMGLLLALLYTLTNHARYNEITAIRAAGISLWRLCVPYLAVGFLATVALFVLNEFCVPNAADRAEDVLRRYVTKKATPEERNTIHNFGFTNMREGRRTWQIGVYNFKTFQMQNPQVNWHSTNGAVLWLAADEAIWTNENWVFSGKVREHIEASGQLRPLLATNLLAMPEFSERPEEIQSEININEGINSFSRTRRADIPLREIFNYLQLHPVPEKTVGPWIYTKLHGRFAGPCVCLVVVLIAVPFAAGSGRRNVFVGVASSIFIFLIYFFLQQLGFAYGEKGQIAAWLAAWFPNLLFGTAGFWMMARVR
ncbi:MAG: lipopolysaccharide export system permease protein [Verrucomicrobiota bacterium]